jgi:3-methyl-2-oxobutanoate hydroxymethyltransferase
MSCPEKITPSLLSEYKSKKKRFASVTAYDMPSAKLAEEAGIELVLVGDSLGMVVMGLDSTRPVTFDQMVYHTKAAKRGIRRSLLAVDMPYETMAGSSEDTVVYARRFIEEAGAGAVKIEGTCFDIIQKASAAGVPVIAHLGLTPQSVEKENGFKVQAKTEKEAGDLLKNAKRVQESGAFALVLECIPWQLAKQVTETLKIPTIGIGAGPYCDGQILVWHDLLGMGPEKKFKFVRRYLDLRKQGTEALRRFRDDVKRGDFPSLEESFTGKTG